MQAGRYKWKRRNLDCGAAGKEHTIASHPSATLRVVCYSHLPDASGNALEVCDWSGVFTQVLKVHDEW